MVLAVYASTLAVGAAAVPRGGGTAASAAVGPAAVAATTTTATAAAVAAADNDTDAMPIVMGQVIHEAPSVASSLLTTATAPPSRQVLTRRPQIVNGVTEDRSSLTGFMVRLLKAPSRGDGPPRFTCGGARITSRHVLTAGHCAPSVGDQVAIGGTDVAGGLRYLVINVTLPPGGSVARADVGILDIAVVEYESRSPLGASGGIAATPVESAAAAAAAAGRRGVAGVGSAGATSRGGGVNGSAIGGGGSGGGSGGGGSARATPRAVNQSDLRIARVARVAGDLPAVNTSVTTLGWGAVFPEKIGALFGPAALLRSVGTRVWAGDDCSAAYASVAASRPPYMFCAAASGAGPCAGDSGGPAGYFPGDGGGFVIVGLVSGTISSLFYRCEPEAPGFYTNIGYFYDFLTEAVAPLKLTT